MRFPSRVIPHAGISARGYLLLVAGVVALGLGSTGCEEQHIGRPCVTNVPADAGVSGGNVAIITSPSLQCPSRICIQPPPLGIVANAEAEGAMCTATCNTDDDCTDTDPGTKCTKGFVCAWPTTSGPFCCQKMCVCHDFVVVPKDGFQTPATCMGPNSGGPSPATCQNVH
jgi:hypothetical protein